MRRPLLACLAALAAVSFGSCAEGEPRLGSDCTPNQRVFCRCPDGSGGTQLCARDGKSFTECGPCAGGAPGDDDDDDGGLIGRPVCGNGLLEPGEQCDDGNEIDDDECSSLCQRRLPGGPVPGEGADLCVGAQPAPLAVGVEFQARQALAAAGADLRGSCGGEGADLVFGLTPAIAGRLDLTLVPEDPALDAVLYVRAGACDDAALEPAGGCQNAAGAGAEEKLSVTVEGNTAYYVFVDAQGPGAGAASFTLRASINPLRACEGEGNPCDTRLPGACAAGALRCVEGQFLVCQPLQGSAAEEACGDGLDNDCDGETDEGCPCAHDKCEAGAQLNPSCTVGGAPDACLQAICADDPFCCDPVASPTGRWDAGCINKVYFVCGTLSCAAHAGACEHGACVEGDSLADGCDGDIGCVEKVCADDPFCCGTPIPSQPNVPPSWDNFCVESVLTLCAVNDQTPVCAP